LSSEKSRLLNLESNITKVVKGQGEAIKAVSEAIKRSRAGISDPNRPIGSFIFLGQTGVGKTEVARQLAKNLFNSTKEMIRLDMSEYAEKHSVSKIIGSPPGYIGYDDGSNLAEQVRKKPYSILLLDEIEKAHKDIYDVFLQILDEGRLTNSKGNTINFKNTVIIMTSNIGQSIAIKNSKSSKEDILKELSKYFRIEFLNRVDEIVEFNKLNPKDYIAIVIKELLNLENRLKDKNYYISFSRLVVEKIAKEAYDPQFGARPIKRYIVNNIENEISDLILNDKIKQNMKLKLTFNKQGHLVIEKRKLN